MNTDQVPSSAAETTTPATEDELAKYHKKEDELSLDKRRTQNQPAASPPLSPDQLSGKKRQLEESSNKDQADGMQGTHEKHEIANEVDNDTTRPQESHSNGSDTRSNPKGNYGQLAEKKNEESIPQVANSREAGLPPGVTVSWQDNQDLIATFQYPPSSAIESNGTSNYSSENQKREEVRSPQRICLCLIGRARLKCLQGCVEVLGHVLTPSSKEVVVTSPFWSSWTTLEVNVSPKNSLSSSVTELSISSIRGSPSFRLVPPDRPTVLPASWRTTADEICRDVRNASCPVRESIEEDTTYEHSNQCIIICGAKGVGKSTFLRYLTNRLLLQASPTKSPDLNATISSSPIIDENCQNHGQPNEIQARISPAVAILDIDVGQPELAPSGVLQLSIQRREPLLQPPYWNLCSQTQSQPQIEKAANPCHTETLPSIPSSKVSPTVRTQPTLEAISSIFYGSFTSKVDPNRYIESIQKLFQDYRDYLAHQPTTIPLIVNMDGWIKGMGFEILCTLLKALNPSHVCQILGESKGKTFDISHVISAPPPQPTSSSSLIQARADNPSTTTNDTQSNSSDGQPKLFYLDACTKHVTPCSVPASTLRTLRLAAYFGPHLYSLWDTLDFLPARLLQTGWAGDDDCTLARYLASERPYCVPMEAIRCTHLNMAFENSLGGRGGNDMGEDSDHFLGCEEAYRERMTLQALNGNIVGLCTQNGNCEGLGIVRSIDWDRRLLYVLTPVAEERLQKVATLVGGNIPPPMPFVFRGVYAESFPYLATISSATSRGSADARSNNGGKVLGSEPMKSRNNIARFGKMGGN